MPFDSTTLSYAEAIEIIGGLSTPSKMPWYGWSIDASECVTGSKLREVEGSICSLCYACKGYYVMPVVKNAMQRRLKALDHPRFVEAFVTVLNSKYEKGRKTYGDAKIKENRFRWHDSGDLQNEAHLEKINRIAELTPRILHYLPTKEAGIVSRVRKKIGDFAPNLFVKLSHSMIGETFQVRPQGMPITTSGRDDDPAIFQCPALRYQGNKCLDCAKCWTDSDINYPVH